MVELNPAFPVFGKEALQNSPHEVLQALLKKGVCYVSGFEAELDRVSLEFELLYLKPDASVRVLSPANAKKNQPLIYSTLFAPEFKVIKRKVFGMFYKDEIEIFCQHTGPSEVPPSATLHFDKRYTFKSWYYLDDVGQGEGAMRVVPPDCCGQYSPAALRDRFGTRGLFKGDNAQHHAPAEAADALEAGAQLVTGPKGTLFFHITEAWHGASPVVAGSARKIIRGHSRAFSDYFLK